MFHQNSFAGKGPFLKICSHSMQVLKPMVKISRTAIEENGYQDIINVIPKRSTEVIVGPGNAFSDVLQYFILINHTDGDMSQRANILVTEVFDSELIGEGAVPTFRHAVKELLEVRNS